MIDGLEPWRAGTPNRVSNPFRGAFAALLTLAFMMQCPIALADPPTSRFVSPDGSDTNPGTRELPLATIQFAVDAVAAGDTVLLLDGTYAGPGNRDLTFRGKNLRLASESDDPTACIIDCEGTSADPHYGFWFHDNEDTTSVIRGITIRNAYVVEPAFAAVMCGDGLDWPGLPGYQRARVKIENVHIVDNRGNGVAAARSSSSVFMNRCYVARNTGSGLALVHPSAVRISDCRFSDNTGHGVSSVGDGPRPGHFIRCQFSGNQGTGFAAYGLLPLPQCHFTACHADSNLGDGYSLATMDQLSLTDCTARSNGSFGLRVSGALDTISVPINGGSYSANSGNGIAVETGGGNLSLSGTTVVGNGGIGINWSGAIFNCTIADALVSNNTSAGMRFDINNASSGGALPRVHRTTLAHNGGEGLAFHFSGMPRGLDFDRILIANNLGPAMDLQGIDGNLLALSCNSLYGNSGGDWLGALAPHLGTNGNMNRIPLFCDAAGGDYHLQSNSLLAAANNACGTIGALDVGCDAPVMSCRELQDYDRETGLCDPTLFNIPVTVEGVVYIAPGTYSQYGGGYLQDASGGMNFWRFPVPTAIRRGDRIRITGPLWPDGDENLYIGNFTYAKLDSQLVPLPVARAIAEIHGDYSLTGEYVKVSGRAAGVGPESFLLQDGTGEIEVRRNAFGGVDFSSVIDGALLEISSPVIKQGPTSYLMPAAQGDVVRSRQHFVGNGGDDANPGTRGYPFRTIQRAVDAAFAGDEVVILDGHYTGPGNVNVTWQDKSLGIRSDSNDRTLCTIDGAGEPGFVYTTTVVAAWDTLTFTGITIAGASTGIGASSGYPYSGFLPVHVAVRNCSLMDGDAGVTVREGSVVVERSNVFRQTTVGVSTWSVWSSVTTIRDCNIRRNGVGVRHVSLWYGSAQIDSTSIVGNGEGVFTFCDNGATDLSHCRVDSSTTGDGLHVRTFLFGPRLADSKFRGNARSGVRFRPSAAGGVSAVRCESVGNGLHGFELASYGGQGGPDELDSVLIADNGAWGIGPYDWSQQDLEFSDLKRIVPGESRGLRLLNSEVRNNGHGGVDRGDRGNLDFANVAILDNGGPGVRAVGGASALTLALTNVTIAGSSGDGLLLARCTGTGTRLAIAGNDSLGINLGEDATLILTCTDIYGNRSGDWVGALASQLGADGNLNVDPRFCDAAAGDYTLQENSPLAAENNPGCGTIGRYGAACPAQPWAPFEPRVQDVPDDQGGYLRVTWLRHGADAPSATVPVTAYDIQRHETEWQTLTTLAAAASDSYAVTVATSDVQIIGQPLPYSRYRLVARTAAPSIFFESAVDSAYSIDNLPPPKPEATLVDAPDYRHIVWMNPDIPDLASACVFRGDAAGFTPGEPLACPSNGFFTETHLRWYFYRVQFADIRGNLSEFSDELHGQWPTGVPGALPTALRLHPCRPNPFNPRTTITYDLPEAGGVRLAVFDLAGRLVRMLVDEGRSQGTYEAVWDGRDAAGREVGSGTYLARLEFGGKVEVVRMGLVR
jgi:hypothetical protein